MYRRLFVPFRTETDWKLWVKVDCQQIEIVRTLVLNGTRQVENVLTYTATTVGTVCLDLKKNRIHTHRALMSEDNGSRLIEL